MCPSVGYGYGPAGWQARRQERGGAAFWIRRERERERERGAGAIGSTTQLLEFRRSHNSGKSEIAILISVEYGSDRVDLNEDSWGVLGVGARTEWYGCEDQVGCGRYVK